MPQDSTGNHIQVGDSVRFRGEVYTIRQFVFGEGLHGTASILFVEDQHTNEVADEISVDKIEGGS